MPILLNNPWDNLAPAQVMQLSRAILKHNPGLFAHFVVLAEEKFLPHVLVELGVFPSTSEIRRNRKDLWRDIDKDCVVKVGRIVLQILTPLASKEAD